MGRTSVLGDVLAARPSVAIKSGASPRPPLLTHTVTLGTGEVYMLGTEDTQASGKRSSTELTSSFPSVSFNILGPKMDSRFSGQGYFVFTHRTDLSFFWLNGPHVPGGRLNFLCPASFMIETIPYFKRLGLPPTVLGEIAWYHTYSLNICQCFA